MLYRVPVETVFMHIVERACFWTLIPESHMFVQFPDVGKFAIRFGMGLLKIIDFIGYLFGQFAAAFLVGNEPERSLPRSITVEVVDPMEQGLFFDEHEGEISF